LPEPLGPVVAGALIVPLAGLGASQGRWISHKILAALQSPTRTSNRSPSSARVAEQRMKEQEVRNRAEALRKEILKIVDNKKRPASGVS